MEIAYANNILDNFQNEWRPNEDLLNGIKFQNQSQSIYSLTYPLIGQTILPTPLSPHFKLSGIHSYTHKYLFVLVLRCIIK